MFFKTVFCAKQSTYEVELSMRTDAKAGRKPSPFEYICRNFLDPIKNGLIGNQLPQYLAIAK